MPAPPLVGRGRSTVPTELRSLPRLFSIATEDPSSASTMQAVPRGPPTPRQQHRDGGAARGPTRRDENKPVRARNGTLRFTDNVNSTSMGTFMCALHGSMSLEEAVTALPGWRASDVNDHIRSIPVYLAQGGTMPDFLQLPDNDAINGIFEREGAELERLLEDLPKNIREGREILTRLFVCDSTSVN